VPSALDGPGDVEFDGERDVLGILYEGDDLCITLCVGSPAKYGIGIIGIGGGDEVSLESLF
jgi:hypothetical protein